jgi:Monooxygenase af470-like
MARVIPSRMTAEVEGDFVVFLIGMRINKPWKVHKWLPVFLAIPRMLKELAAAPGIWHEIYQARAGDYETVYSGMPPFGLGKVGALVPASGRRESARGRFVRAESPEAAATPHARDSSR